MAPRCWVSFDQRLCGARRQGRLLSSPLAPFNVIPQTDKMTRINCCLAVFLLLVSLWTPGLLPNPTDNGLSL